jgi:myosin heavy subunit
VDVVDIKFPDLLPTLQMLQGIFSSLDDQCALNGSELVFVEEITKKYHKTVPVFHKDLTKRNMFSVVHFAGMVNYNVDGWIEKNRDTLKPVFREAIFANVDATKNVLSSIVLSPPTTVDISGSNPAPAAVAGAPQRKSKAPMSTVSTSFLEYWEP